ncbi:MAG: glutamine amidotransferase [Cyclobacteriaceae bacterium]
MAKIYYVGDWAVLTGPVFAETPFHYSHKGLDIFNYGKWLKEALEETGEHEVNSVSAWDFYNKLGPGDYESILDEYNLIIFSDVDAKLFQLAPGFFDREKFGQGVLTYPDRIRLTVEAAHRGTRFMFLGGWYSFTGELGKGGWGRTRLKEILPVECLEIEDLVESTEGFQLEAVTGKRKIFSDLDLQSCPPILGYNQTRLLSEAEILMRFKETNHPALALREVGHGKVMAYMSDPAPHWACNFVYWEGYGAFWRRCVDLVLG